MGKVESELLNILTSNIQIHQYTNTPIYKYTNTQIANIQITDFSIRFLVCLFPFYKEKILLFYLDNLCKITYNFTPKAWKNHEIFKKEGYGENQNQTSSI